MSLRPILTGLTLLVSTGVLAQHQVRDGIAGFPWGTSRQVIAERLMFAPGARGDGFLAAEIDAIEGVPVTSCLLEFRGGRLCGVALTTRGHSASLRLRALLKEAYGEGHAEGPRAHQWLSHVTHATYDEDDAGSAYVYWYSLRSHPGADSSAARIR